MLGFVIGFILGGFISFVLTRRWAKGKAATWYVQPAPTRRQARTHRADPDVPVVSESVFVRTNLPGSTSNME